MNTYVIRRRNGWANAEELERSAGISARVGNEEMSDEVRWIRTYVVAEEDGSLGTVCIYQGTSPEAVREHAHRSGMPADEVYPLTDTVIVRDDPKEKIETA
jgi:hypothetical protein